MSGAGRCTFCRAGVAAQARFCSACGTPVAPAGETASRRIVTVLFCDLVGSTAVAQAVDPEAVHAAMDGYYDACRTAIEKHQGVVEKFIGDAVMAVFGAGTSHDDDALRAVRAARDIVEALVELNVGLDRDLGFVLRVRCGLDSGEAVVVAQSPAGGARVIGDVVNTAARLQAAAGVGEIFIGTETVQLCGAAVHAQAVPPLTLKGKSAPVPAYRFVSIDEAPGRAGGTALVGRAVELDHLRQVYRRVRRGRRCCLVTVVGSAGIGKSRLVQEFLADRTLADALILPAACQPYGTGLTYRPVADLIRSLPGGWGEAVAVLQAESDVDGRALTALAAALDLDPAGAPAIGTDEITWAFRCLVEALGRTRPLVLVLDNLQWAQPILLDLVMDVVGGVVDAEVMVICVSRPELLDARPQWGGGIGCATSFELDPLTVEESLTLVGLLADAAEVTGQDQLHSGQSLDRIAAQSDGNPLHAELLMQTRATGVQSGIPPTIRVLITAWLDRLHPADRNLLERAATISTGAFTVEEVRFLAGDSPRLTGPDALDEALRRLLRTNTIERSGPKGEYRITRPLARDVIYEMTPKDRRVIWHEALADRLAAGLEDGGRYGRQTDADLAFHLVGACQLKREIRPGDASLTELSGRASRALIATGMRALRRRDLQDAATLLERGRDLLPEQHPDHRILAVRISDAHAGRGDWASAYETLDRIRDAVDPRARHTAQIQRRIVTLRSGRPDDGPLDGADLDEDDDLSWCRLHQLVGLRFMSSGRQGAAEAAMRAALVRAGRLGDVYEEDRLLVAICELTQWSPTPVDDAIALCRSLAERFAADRYPLIPILLTHARLEALTGRLEEARQRVAVARGYSADLRLTLGRIAAAQVESLIESSNGEHRRAYELLAACARDLAAAGQRAMAAMFQVRAAWELVRAGDAPAASTLASAVEPAGLGTEERIVHLLIGAHVKVAASAVPGALVAVAIVDERLGHVDDPVFIGEVLFDVAKILTAAGEHQAARSAARRAAASFRAKGATRPAGLAQSWLAARGGER